MKFSGKLKISAVLLLTVFMMLSVINVFAFETQSVTLDKATVGIYYEQFVDIDAVLENVDIPTDKIPGGYDVNKLSIYSISYDEKELPPGLEITHTSRSAKFAGIPTQAGTYIFKVTVIAQYQVSFGGFTQNVPLTDMPAEVNVTLTVLPGEVKPIAPVFTSKPSPSYSAPKGSSITVPVAATCLEGSNFALYVKKSGSWSMVDSKSGVSSWDMKPLDAAGLKNTVGTHEFKVVAENAQDSSLKNEVTFSVKIEQKAPSVAAITGITQFTENDLITLICTSDGDNLTYKWQIKTKGASSWSDIAKNESNLTATAILSYDGAQLKCIVSNNMGSKESNIVTLKVTAAHQCSYTISTVIRNATCTTSGEEKLSCTCGKYTTKTINATGHKYSNEWYTETPAGCTTSGVKSHRCTVCQDKKDLTPIEPKGHSYGAWVVIKEATTTAEGLERRTCGNCGNFEEKTIAKVVDGHTHSFSDWTVIKEATCTQSGERKKSCSCGQVETEIISAYGHSYSTDYTVIQEATCTQSGSKSRKCTKCDSQTDVTVIAAKGHSFGSWTVFKEATTESEGEERRNCAKCEYYESKTIAKLVEGHTHSFGDWMVVTHSTCEGSGLEMHACSCGSAETRQTSPKGHSFGSWKVIIAPTVAEDGLEIRSCMVEGCKGTESRIIEKLPEGTNPSDTTTHDQTVVTTPDSTTPDDTYVNPPVENESDDDPIIKYLLIVGCALLAGVFILLVVMLFSKKKSRWE